MNTTISREEGLLKRIKMRLARQDVDKKDIDILARVTYLKRIDQKPEDVFDKKSFVRLGLISNWYNITSDALRGV